MNSTNLDGGSDFNVKEGVKKLNGSVKKKRILVCKFKSRSALSLFQFGSIKVEKIKIQKIKKNNLKSLPVFLKRIK